LVIDIISEFFGCWHGKKSRIWNE